MEDEIIFGGKTPAEILQNSKPINSALTSRAPNLSKHTLATAGGLANKGYNIDDYMGGIDVESINSLNQSGSEQLLKGVGRIASKTLAEIIKMPGYAGGLVGAAFAEEGEGWDTAFNNDWIQGVDEAHSAVNDSLFKIHSAGDYSSLGLGGKLATTEFWATEGADGAGYLLSMMAPGAALSALKAGKGLLKGIAGAAELTGKGNGFSTLKTLASIGVNVDRVDNVLITAANTYMEAGAEAGSAIKNLEAKKPELIEQWVKPKRDRLSAQLMNGEITQDQYNQDLYAVMQKAEQDFKDQKGRLGRDVFLANAAILLGPNALQTKMLYGKGAKSYNVDATAPKWYKSAGKGLATGIAMEGFFEEGMQSTVENMFSKSADKRQLTTNPLLDFNLGELAEGYVDTLTSTEGQSAIFLGALMGGGMNAYGGVKEAKNEYDLINKINTQFQVLPSQAIEAANSIYKKDKDGNIELDYNNKPILDIKNATKQGLSMIGTQMLNKIQENAVANGDQQTADYIVDYVAADLGNTFGLINSDGRVRGAAKDALEQHLDQNIEAIRANDKLDASTKEVMIANAERVSKVATRAFNTAVNHTEAFNILAERMLPDINNTFTGVNALQDRERFIHAAKKDMFHNRIQKDLLDSLITDKEAELTDLYKKLNIDDVLSFGSPLEQANQNPLTTKKFAELEQLKEQRDNFENDYKNYILKPEAHLNKMREASDLINKMSAEHLNKAKEAEVLTAIENATTTEALNKIKLPKELEGTSFKDTFDAAIGKKKANVKDAKKQADTSASELNQRDDNEINDAQEYTFNETGGSWDTGEDGNFEVTYEVDFDKMNNPPEGAEVLANAYVMKDEIIPFGIDTTGVVLLEADARDLSNKDVEELLAKEAIPNEPEEVVETKNDGTKPDEGLSTEQGVGESVEIPEEAPNTLSNSTITNNNPSRLSTEVTIEAQNQIPEDPEVDGKEFVDNNNMIQSEAEYEASDDSFSFEFSPTKGVISNFVTKLARLVLPIENSLLQSKFPKVYDYLNNHRRKAGDTFEVKVMTLYNGKPNTGKAFQLALSAYNKLVEIQKTGKGELTTSEYEELLYRLPLSVSIPGNNKDLMYLDTLHSEQMYSIDPETGETNINAGGMAFVNAFQIRLQIINALIQDVNAPISLMFAKQHPGFLNLNRNEQGVSVTTGINNLWELQKLNPAERTAFLKESLAYVNLERMVKGLSNDNVISTGAKTPGIIYIRLFNRNGAIKNVQVSRKKLDDNLDDNSLSLANKLALLLSFNANENIDAFNTPFNQLLSTLDDSTVIDVLNTFAAPIEILKEAHGENFTIFNLMDFFIHTSNNDVTKFNIQQSTNPNNPYGHVEVGTLINKLLNENNSHLVTPTPTGGLKMTAEALNTQEGIDLLTSYFQMIKHNVKREYAQYDSYINYLADNVLVSDIKPNEPTFIVEGEQITRHNDGNSTTVTSSHRKYESNIMVSNVVNIGGNTNRQISLPEQVVERMDPKLKRILDHQNVNKRVSLPTTAVFSMSSKESSDNEQKKVQENPTPVVNVPNTVVAKGGEVVEEPVVINNENNNDVIILNDKTGQVALDLFNDETITDEEAHDKLVEELKKLPEEQQKQLDEISELQSEIETQKANIERKRQRNLEYKKQYYRGIGIFDLIESEDDTGLGKDIHVGYFVLTIDTPNQKIGENRFEFKTLKEAQDFVNAKYDAEIAALEQAQPVVKTSDNELASRIANSPLVKAREKRDADLAKMSELEKKNPRYFGAANRDGSLDIPMTTADDVKESPFAVYENKDGLYEVDLLAPYQSSSLLSTLLTSHEVYITPLYENKPTEKATALRVTKRPVGKMENGVFKLIERGVIEYSLGGKWQTDVYADNAIKDITENYQDEQFKQAQKNKAKKEKPSEKVSDNELENFIKNGTTQQNTTVRTNDETTSTEVSSSTESTEDVQGTQKTIKTIGESKSELDTIRNTFDNLNEEVQVELLVDIIADSNTVVLDEATLGMLDTADSRKELLDILIADAEAGFNIVELTNKICGF